MEKEDNVLKYLFMHASHISDKTAIIEADSGYEITYGKLWEMVRCGSSFLKRYGIRKGDIVCIAAFSTVEFFVSYFATQLLGATAVPLEKQLSEERTVELKEYFHTEYFLGKKCGIMDANQEESGEITFPDSSSVGTIIFTTGTTSQNKGVMLSLRNSFSSADNYVQAISLGCEDVISVSVPMSHSGGLRHVLASVIAGSTVVLFNNIVFVKSVLEAFHNYRVTVLRVVPTQLSILIKQGGHKLAALGKQIRCVTIGSALTPESEKEKLRSLLPDTRLFVTYGCTEAAGFSHFEFSKYLPKPYCVGKAAIHSQFHIVDENGHDIVSSKEAPGIIALSGDNVMQGYYGDPELTAQTILNGMVITADMGYQDEEGFYYVIGRRDDVIVSGGYKILPADVENALLALPEVEDAACIGIEDMLLGKKPRAFVVMKTGKMFEAQRIREALYPKLEQYKIPDVKDIVCIGKIPRTGTAGKILYRELREKYGK